MISMCTSRYPYQYYRRITDSEMDLFHCMRFSDSDSWISACMGGTERGRDSELGTCLARQLHAEIDRLHDCMSDSGNLSGAESYPGLSGNF